MLIPPAVPTHPSRLKRPLSMKTAVSFESGLGCQTVLLDPRITTTTLGPCVFSTLSAPRALSPRRRGHFRPLIVAFRGGTHAQTPLDAPEACSRLSFRYIFARSRALIAALHRGTHAQTPSDAPEARTRQTLSVGRPTSSIGDSKLEL